MSATMEMIGGPMDGATYKVTDHWAGFYLEVYSEQGNLIAGPAARFAHAQHMRPWEHWDMEDARDNGTWLGIYKADYALFHLRWVPA